MEPGDFYLLSSNDYHRIHLSSHKVTLLSIFFHLPETDSEITSLLKSNPCPVVGTIPPEDRLLFEQLIKQIYEAENFSLDDDNDTISLSALLALHIAYRSKPNPLSDNKLTDNYLQRALHYILAHYNEPLTLDLVAKEIGLSYNYFCSMFSSQVGCSFLEYLNNLRVQKAQNMLIYDHQKSVTGIALEVGFGSYSNFYRSFLRTVGLSPKDYRAQKNKVEHSDPT